MPDVRAEIRIEAQKQTVATMLGHPDIDLVCDVRDISKSGMRIFVDREVPLGTVMKVEWGEHFLVGRTQRVVASGPGYEVGLELMYCSKWKDPIASAMSALSALSR